MKSVVLTILAGLLLALIAAQSLGLLIAETGEVTVFAPCSMLLVFLGGNGPPSWILIAAVPTLVFWVWSPGLFRGKATIPLRSILLLAISVVASIVWFVGSWRYGLKYEGLTYSISTALLSVILAVLTGVLILQSRKSPSFAINLLVHFVLFAWLTTYAFPFFGELP